MAEQPKNDASNLDSGQAERIIAEQDRDRPKWRDDGAHPAEEAAKPIPAANLKKF